MPWADHSPHLSGSELEVGLCLRSQTQAGNHWAKAFSVRSWDVDNGRASAGSGIRELRLRTRANGLFVSLSSKKVSRVDSQPPRPFTVCASVYRAKSCRKWQCLISFRQATIYFLNWATDWTVYTVLVMGEIMGVSGSC